MPTARWSSDAGAGAGRVTHSSSNEGFYVAAIVLSAGRSNLRVDGLPVHDGAVRFGSTLVTAPMQEARVDSAHSCNVFHLFIPPELLDQAIDGHGHGGTHLSGRAPRVDAALAHAASSWVDIQGESGPNRALYAECLGEMMLRRIVGTHLRLPRARPPVASLQPWRLRRVLEYVETRLDGAITLGDMARAAELSPMHFAAQFRRATGLTPYQHVLRRRVERAQDLMRRNDHKLVEIAAMLGFSSQAHLSTTFRATVGVSPRQWRDAAIGACRPAADD